MDNSMKTGFMAVFAVSGSVVFLAMQAHNRLLSNFMKKMEFEFNHQPTGVVKDEPKKRVRFDVVKERKNLLGRSITSDGSFEAMPENWQAMYKGILQNKNLRIID